MIFILARQLSVAFYLFSVLFSEGAFAQKFYGLEINYEQSQIPPQPDYALEANWSALPFVKDMADKVPKRSGLKDRQTDAKADVFFIYPTIFTYEPSGEFKWNASVEDKELNEKVDMLPVLNQSTAFNGSCKVYVPRYRQAHYSAFTSEDELSAEKALDLAYQDVKKAFEYYLENYNDDRPIVIASHSQGTVHAVRLLKDFFDEKPLLNQLVQAYLIGMPIRADEFESIPASSSPETLGGFATWNTFSTGYYPSYYEDGLNRAICTNPLTWRTDEVYADYKMNSGGVGLKFKFVKSPVDAQVKDGLLWIGKPDILGSGFIKSKIWHKADINLYWMNIRENVDLRIASYIHKNRTNER